MYLIPLVIPTFWHVTLPILLSLEVLCYPQVSLFCSTHAIAFCVHFEQFFRIFSEFVFCSSSEAPYGLRAWRLPIPIRHPWLAWPNSFESNLTTALKFPSSLHLTLAIHWNPRRTRKPLVTRLASLTTCLAVLSRLFFSSLWWCLAVPFNSAVFSPSAGFVKKMPSKLPVENSALLTLALNYRTRCYSPKSVWFYILICLGFGFCSSLHSLPCFAVVFEGRMSSKALCGQF